MTRRLASARRQPDCGTIQCPETPPPGSNVASFAVNDVGGGQCQCVAQCVEGYALIGGLCVQDVPRECPEGFVDENQLCIPQTDVSCYDVPTSPICFPTRCAEQPTAADGTDLRALGKCVDDPPPPVESCVNNCHNGIEDPHPWFGGPDLSCTGCHGGRSRGHQPDPSACCHSSRVAGWSSGDASEPSLLLELLHPDRC